MNTNIVLLYRVVRCLGFIIFLLIAQIDNAVSQDAFQWKDKSGRIIYGTKPPKKGKGSQIKSFKTRKLSHYSSKKVLKRMGRSENEALEQLVDADKNNVQEQAKKNEIEEIPLDITATRVEPTDGREQVIPNSGFANIPIKKPTAEVEKKESSPIKNIKEFLAIEEPRVEWAVTGELTSCQVSITNTSQSDIEDVSVAFRFADKELIPASGSFVIESGATGIYVIPSELVPMDLSLDIDAVPVPEVVVHAKEMMVQ